MKRVLILSILFFSMISLKAQEGFDVFVPGIGGQIDNIPARGQSAIILGELTLLRYPRERDLKNDFREFRKEYKKRVEYYLPTIEDKGQFVLEELDRLITRLNYLRVENNKVFLYKGLKQKTLEKDINHMLEVIEFQRTKIFNNGGVTTVDSFDDLLALIASTATGGFVGKSKINAIYGERMNLNQNILMTTEELQRKLDDVESTIDKRGLLSKFFTK